MAATLKAYKGMGMEGSTARWYDRTTRKDLPEIRELAARIAALVPPAGDVLEVAPGPGFLSIELARRGLHVRAVDISKTFVEIVQRNAAADNVTVAVQQGNASALPFPDACGTALLIDMRRDVALADIKRYVDNLGVSWLNRRFMMFTFRHMLIKRAYPLDEIRRMATQAGWSGLRIETGPLGFDAWTTK